MVIKCYLHVTPEDQRERLQERLDDPTKHWKYKPGDLDVRAKWPDYQAAYADALERCNTDAAPWFVIPAGRKWYRNWAVAALINEQLGRPGADLAAGRFRCGSREAAPRGPVTRTDTD